MQYKKLTRLKQQQQGHGEQVIVNIKIFIFERIIGRRVNDEFDYH